MNWVVFCSTNLVMIAIHSSYVLITRHDYLYDYVLGWYVLQHLLIRILLVWFKYLLVPGLYLENSSFYLPRSLEPLEQPLASFEGWVMRNLSKPQAAPSVSSAIYICMRVELGFWNLLENVIVVVLLCVLGRFKRFMSFERWKVQEKGLPTDKTHKSLETPKIHPEHTRTQR